MLSMGSVAFAQTFGQFNPDEPGNAMIQTYLAQEAKRIDRNFLSGIKTLQDWQQVLPKLRQEYFTMLGLWPMPKRTPLEAKITSTLIGDDYAVDMLCYQSCPQLYVTANLYRPTNMKAGEQSRLPAVLYLCGHAAQGRNGNKTSFQSFGLWLARHGYVCLIVDTLQMGEIESIHHGTYNRERWWWHSRGYTPAGVECWNGIRGIDYLVSREDVDCERIAVTGISGGGAVAFWVAAADERVKVAITVSGMADLQAYISDRVIEGHCDCMFLYNTFQWPWSRFAALVAPRPLLFVNSDHDSLFPMDANHRVINRLEKVYSLYGASDLVDSIVSIGDHDYRSDIRQATFRFLNTFLKNDPRNVTDSESDVWNFEGGQPKPPIELERLRVFPSDGNLPSDQRNTAIDQYFVPLASVVPPEVGLFTAWKENLLASLRNLPFHVFPQRVAPARLLEQQDPTTTRLGSEDGIEFYLGHISTMTDNLAKRVLLVVADENFQLSTLKDLTQPDDAIYICYPRGIGPTRWSRKTPGNYVERSLALLGRTADTGRVWDIIAAARYLNQSTNNKQVYLAGHSNSAVLAVYAALFEPEIAGVLLVDPRLTHADSKAPQFLSVLRVCDVLDALGMLAPRPLTIRMHNCDELLKKVEAIYTAAGAASSLTLIDTN